MNNNADFLAGENKEVCELSSESDSDSDTFYLVGGQSDYDSDSFILVGDECDPKKVQDIKCERSPVDEEGSEVDSKIKTVAPQDQVDTEYANIDKEDNSDKHVAAENVHDVTSMAEEEVDQTGLTETDEFSDDEEKKPATTTTKHNEDESDQICKSIVNCETQVKEIDLEENSPVDLDEKQETAFPTTKPTQDDSIKFCEDMDNNKTSIKKSNLVDSYLVVPETNKIVGEENYHVDDQCSESNNFNIKEKSSDEEEYTDEEDEYSDDEEECTDEGVEFSDNEENEPATAATKFNAVGSDQSRKDIENSETNTTEINLDESNSIIPVASNSDDKEIKQLEDARRSVTDNVNNKEGLRTNEEEQCTDQEREFTDKEDELNDNEEQELATATSEHNKDGSNQFCNDIVNSEMKTKEINLERSSPIVPDDNNSIYKEIKQVEGDRCDATENVQQSEDSSDELCEDIVNKETKSADISLVESNSVVPEANKSIDVENYHCIETNYINIEAVCTDEEEEYTDKEKEYTDDEEECTDEEEKFTDEEKLVTAITKHNQDESDEFCKAIVNSETNTTTKINLERSSPIVPEENNITYKEIEQVEGDRCNATENIQQSEANKSIDVENYHCIETNNINIEAVCTDEEEEYTDEEEEYTDDEEECTGEEDKFTDEEKLVTAITKHNQDESDEFCKSIVKSETNTTKINLERSIPIVPDDDNSIYKEIKQVEGDRCDATEMLQQNAKEMEHLEDYHCKLSVNVNRKEGCFDKQKKLSVEEEKSSMTTITNDDDDSDKFSPIVPEENNIIYKEIKQVEGDRRNATEMFQMLHQKATEIWQTLQGDRWNATEMLQMVTEILQQNAKEMEHLEDYHCNLSVNVNRKEGCFDEQKKLSVEEEKSSMTTITNDDDDSDKFSPIVPKENNIVYKEIKQVEGDRRNATEMVQMLTEMLQKFAKMLQHLQKLEQNAKEPVHLEDYHCNLSVNVNRKEGCFDEQKKLSVDEEKSSMTTITNDDDDSDKFCKNIVSSETKTEETKLRKNDPVVLEKDEVNKKIESAEGSHYSETMVEKSCQTDLVDNINNQEECSNENEIKEEQPATVQNSEDSVVDTEHKTTEIHRQECDS